MAGANVGLKSQTYNFIDMTGQRFGRLVVLERDLSRGMRRTYWFCQCDCGERLSVEATKMRIGHTQSCGCKSRERISALNRSHGFSRKSSEYIAWKGMRQRCLNPKSQNYKDYGGRGITICDKWENFLAFLEDVGPRPEGYMLGRINTAGPYSPENCRWAAPEEQRKNKRKKEPKIRFCSFEGCGNKHVARGMCFKHYQRWHSHGDPSKTIKYEEPSKYFQEVVIKYTGDNCLVWPYSKTPDGYGHFRYKGKCMTANRAVCLELYGDPPSPDHESAHSCGNGRNACCNPKHLRWATQLENVADRKRHGPYQPKRASKASLT